MSAIDKLLDERAELEKRALEWGDRWLATGHGFSIVHPITFDRSEVAARQGERAETPNELRARLGLPPLTVVALEQLLDMARRSPTQSI